MAASVQPCRVYPYPCGTRQGLFLRRRTPAAIGTVVNRAARVQAAAKSGQILVTLAARERARDLVPEVASDHSLKGFDAPLTLFAVETAGAPR